MALAEAKGIQGLDKASGWRTEREVTLPKFNIAPWKVTFPIGKDRFPTTILSGAMLNFGGVAYSSNVSIVGLRPPIWMLTRVSLVHAVHIYWHMLETSTFPACIHKHIQRILHRYTKICIHTQICTLYTLQNIRFHSTALHYISHIYTYIKTMIRHLWRESHDVQETTSRITGYG